LVAVQLAVVSRSHTLALKGTFAWVDNQNLGSSLIGMAAPARHVFLHLGIRLLESSVVGSFGSHDLATP